MRTYKTKKGYFYKEYKNGKKKRISKEEHQKLKKDTKKTVTKKTVTKKNKYRKKIKQRGGNPLTTSILSDKLLDKGKIILDEYVIVNLYRGDESWNSKCKQRKTVTESTCKTCTTSKSMSLLYQCSYCGFKYHNDCTLWHKFPLKSTAGTFEGVPIISKIGHAKGKTNETTDVCGNCFKFLTAATEFIENVKQVLPNDKQQMLDGTYTVTDPYKQRRENTPARILNTYNKIEVGDKVRILTERLSKEDTGKDLEVMSVRGNVVKVQCQRSNRGGHESYLVTYKKEEVRVSKKKD
tara:strand:- start:912 stop:1793 length:882 start_codon:yes stop_codon:yes gene_type:complete